MNNWNSKEIKITRKILKDAPAHRDMQLMLYWFVILIMVVLTLLISIYLVPFFLVLSSPYIFLIVFLLSLAFGAMFNNLVVHLEHLETSHYVVAGIIIPLVAISALFLTTHVATYMAALLDLPIRQDPFAVGIVYLIGFLLPYFYGMLYQRNTFKA